MQYARQTYCTCVSAVCVCVCEALLLLPAYKDTCSCLLGHMCTVHRSSIFVVAYCGVCMYVYMHVSGGVDVQMVFF